MSNWSEDESNSKFDTSATNVTTENVQDIPPRSPSSLTRMRSRSPGPRDSSGMSPERRARSRSPSDMRRSYSSFQRSNRFDSNTSRDNYSRPPRRRNLSPAAPCNVIGVFGLSSSTNERALEGIFSEFGPIKKIDLICDRVSGLSKGFGFIYYDEVEQAQAAKDKTNGMDVDGRQIRVDFSKSAGPRPSNPSGPRNDGGSYAPRSRDFPPRHLSRSHEYERQRSRSRERPSYNDRSSSYRSRSPYSRHMSRRESSRSPPPPLPPLSSHHSHSSRRSYSRSPPYSAPYNAQFSSGAPPMRDYDRRPY